MGRTDGLRNKLRPYGVVLVILCTLVLLDFAQANLDFHEKTSEKLYGDTVVGWRSAGPLGTYTYVIGCKRKGVAALIDATGDVDEMVEFAKGHGLTITHLLQTHEHFDHTMHLADAKAATNADIYLHADGLKLYSAVPDWASEVGMEAAEPPPLPDKSLQDGEVLKIGKVSLEVIATPGHAQGHVCFYNQQNGIMFSGDLIIRGAVGRTDIPGANVPAMKQSLRKIAKYPGETVLFSGHSPTTTLKTQIITNPLLKELLGRRRPKVEL